MKKTMPKGEGAVVIRAAHYEETVKRLMTDPIVRAMAATLPDGVDMQSWEFTLAAMREYDRRGGKHAGHIGGVAEAIRALKSEG